MLTSRKVVGPITDEVTGFFNLLNNSIRTIVLGFTKLLVTANVVPSLPILATLMKEALKFLRNVASYKSHTA
jgi:hypothetical protein